MRGVRISYLVEHTQNTFRTWGSGCLMIVLVLLIDLLNVAIAHAAERGDFGGLVDIGNGCGK